MWPFYWLVGREAITPRDKLTRVVAELLSWSRFSSGPENHTEHFSTLGEFSFGELFI